MGFFQAILDLLCLDLRFILGGIVLIGASIYWLYKRKMLTVKISIVLVIFYYYLAVILSHIVGVPTLKEFIRLSALGEPLFYPNVNLIPFAEGLSLEFLLNIFCFIPLGFFCPMISKTYVKVKNTLLVGFCFSLAIEIIQLFTLYRVTDINDIIANTFGTAVGCFCFKLIMKSKNKNFADDPRSVAGLPVLYLILTLAITFIQF